MKPRTWKVVSWAKDDAYPVVRYRYGAHARRDARRKAADLRGEGVRVWLAERVDGEWCERQ